MNILALDIGRRRTGVAFCDGKTQVPVTSQTLHHDSDKDCISQVCSLVRAKNVRRIIIGLPLLPSGKEGMQAQYVRHIAHALEGEGFSVAFIDERYTTPRKSDHDQDAVAACTILGLYLEQRK